MKGNCLPLVSVIIPFFSGKEWLYESINSVLAQTYPNYEILLINDGSKEDINDLLRYYNGKIKYFYQQNQGVAVARNNGMKMANGEYIAFLDSDDIWLPQKLEIQILFMTQINAVWSHTGFYYWYPESDRVALIDNHFDYGDVKKKFYVSMKVATPSVIVKSSVLKEHPEIDFPKEFKRGQDTQFYRSLANLYPIALIQEPLLKVRMRSDNSYRQAYARFKTNAIAFDRYKKSTHVPKLAKFIFGYYKLAYKILGSTKTDLKEKFALFLWVLPYVVERLYTKYIVLTQKKMDLYLLPYKKEL